MRLGVVGKDGLGEKCQNDQASKREQAFETEVGAHQTAWTTRLDGG